MRKQPNLNAFAAMMTSAVQRAAITAHKLEGRVTNTPKTSELTAVKQALTEADTRVQEEILEVLIEHYPEVCLEAEEDTQRVKDFPVHGDALVIIDRLTARFSPTSKGWAHTRRLLVWRLGVECGQHLWPCRASGFSFEERRARELR